MIVLFIVFPRNKLRTVRLRGMETPLMETIMEFPPEFPEKWKLPYFGPGGLDSVFYLPCTVYSLVRISSLRVGIVSHR